MKSLTLILLMIFSLSTSYSQVQKTSPILDEKPLLNQGDETDIENMDPVYTLIGIPTELNQKCIDFFNILMTGDVEKAYTEFLKNSPLIRNKDKIKEQVMKTNQAIELYGKITGHEQAGAEYISVSYVKVKYLSLHPFNPILWTFTFYNSPTIGWIVLNLKYTDTF